MPIRYTARDTELRLLNTIIRYGEEVVLVTDILHGDGDLQVKLFFPLTGNFKWCPVSDEKINVKAFSPGYINYCGIAPFITRGTYRQSRQGLCGRNSSWRDGDLSHIEMLASIALSMKGHFPSIKSTIDWLEREQKRGVAISRNLAINLRKGKLLLSFNGKEVGEVLNGKANLFKGLETFSPIIFNSCKELMNV